MKNFYLNRKAIELLNDAQFIRAPKFMTFGKYHGYLAKFAFIDDENQVTSLGRQFLIKCYEIGYL